MLYSLLLRKLTVGLSWDKLKGKNAKSIDNKEIGKIKEISQDYIQIEKGIVSKDHFFVPKYFVEGYEDDDIIISLTEDEIKKQYYYDEEPAASQYDLEMSEFNTKYGKNKSKTTNEKIKLKEGTELKTKSKKGYKNIRDLK